MVSENTVKNYLKKALEPYKAGYTYITNRGGYSVKKNVYRLDDADLVAVQNSIKYGTVTVENGMLYCVCKDDGEFHCVSEFVCAKEITPIDCHHTYDSRMLDNKYSIEKIIKQSDKAIYVRVKSSESEFRYEKWLPKTTVYEIKRELEQAQGVISKWNNTQFAESYRVLVRGYLNKVEHNDMTYGDKMHADRRVADLMAEGYVVYSEKTNEATGETVITMATPYSIEYAPYDEEAEKCHEKWAESMSSHNEELSDILHDEYQKARDKAHEVYAELRHKMVAGIAI